MSILLIFFDARPPSILRAFYELSVHSIKWLFEFNFVHINLGSLLICGSPILQTGNFDFLDRTHFDYFADWRKSFFSVPQIKFQKLKNLF